MIRDILVETTIQKPPRYCISLKYPATYTKCYAVDEAPLGEIVSKNSPLVVDTKPDHIADSITITDYYDPASVTIVWVEWEIGDANRSYVRMVRQGI